MTIFIFADESTKNGCVAESPGRRLCKFGSTSGGMNAHCSAPVASSKACSMPSFEPTMISALVPVVS